MTLSTNREKTVMRQRWNDLLFLHWPVDFNELQLLLPPGLSVDMYDGKAYVALVPFRMSNVHPSWFTPVPGISDLLECNVRTYVRHEGGEPGVWFFSLDASNAIAVAIARTIWRLPYFYAQMSQTETRIRDESQGWSRRVSYRAVRKHPGYSAAQCSVRYEPYGLVATAKPGSLDEFFVERYLLYAYRNKTLYCGRVGHYPYQIQPVRVLELEENLVAAAGITVPDSAPLACYSRNVVVEVFPLRSVTPKMIAANPALPTLVGQPA